MIPLCVPHIEGNEWTYVKDCLDTNWVSSAGSYVDLFEERFAAYVGAQRAVVMVNGTAALHMALRSLDIQEGDEVIVPSMTFISPVNAIRYVGAQPVFADVSRDTYVMDAERIEALITPRTKAILPVHLYGHPVDMDPVMRLASQYGLFVIEDATESLGSLYHGKATGTIGHVGCFSFNGNKLITTGAGGMLVSNDREIGNRAKYLSNQTKSTTENGGFQHEEIGYNFRMPNLLAAMGVAQLESIEKYIAAKEDTAAMYRSFLADVQGITLPIQREWAFNVNWLYSVVVEKEYPIDRDQLIQVLRRNGIEARPFFMPVHEMPPYRNNRHGDMGMTMELSKRGLNLPSSVGLTSAEIEKICDVIRNPG